ncbi:LytR C-terminal domain-containing protein [Nocardioides sp. HDW12B]|uniref:LytR C-terminal domain-containing protein n=1 Tax=Nocardioides sp. HDW12B TaxID=2714939 RepID=UPI00140E10C6|nr:LytR C-terminal domain-containing protein [Nocardioides sp. HDW12B]QIK67680.1 LytR C-terminal domain-containing protein [Nocardioides sp. HDW12B]
MRSRRALTAVTLVVLLGLLVVGTYVGWRSLSAPVADDDTTSEVRCREGVQRGDRLAREDVTVSVYNAGSRSGLAGRTQEELTARGFIAGDIGNAPAGLGDVRVVRVLAASRQDPAALLVARQFGTDTFLQVTGRDLGAGVDVVVGDDYAGLVKAPRSITARAEGSGC